MHNPGDLKSEIRVKMQELRHLCSINGMQNIFSRLLFVFPAAWKQGIFHFLLLYQ